jgi:hypothetical protein
MRRLFVLILAIAFANSSYCQRYINLTKPASRKTFLKYVNKETYHTIVTETDSTLVFLIRDPTVQNLDMRLHFDRQGRCDIEVQKLYCDSCYQKLLHSALADQRYRWIKADDSTYYSKFSKRLMLKAGYDDPFSFSVSRISLTENEYALRTKNITLR